MVGIARTLSLRLPLLHARKAFSSDVLAALRTASSAVPLVGSNPPRLTAHLGLFAGGQSPQSWVRKRMLRAVEISDSLVLLKNTT